MIVIAAHILNTLILGINPAAVNCPVSASLVGRSSHVKLSVKSITRSIMFCWSLRQRRQTVKQSQLPYGEEELKNRTKLLTS